MCHRGRLAPGIPDTFHRRRPATPKASVTTNAASSTEASCLSFGQYSASSSAPPSRTSERKGSRRYNHDQHPEHSPSAATVSILIASAEVSRNLQDRRSSCSYRVQNPSQSTYSTTGQRNAVTATTVRPHNEDGERKARDRVRQRRQGVKQPGAAKAGGARWTGSTGLRASTVEVLLVRRRCGPSAGPSSSSRAGRAWCPGPPFGGHRA